MWSSLLLDNIIKITFVGAGVAIIYAALKPNKTETKTNYTVTVDAPNLTKEETEQFAKKVIENMKKRNND
jgi:short subunit fatty acids transporter